MARSSRSLSSRGSLTSISSKPLGMKSKSKCTGVQIFALGVSICFLSICIIYIVSCQNNKFFEENTNGIVEIWSCIFVCASCIIYVIECQLVKRSKKCYTSKYSECLQVFLLLSSVCFLCCSISLMLLLFSGASTICFLGSIFSFIFTWLVKAEIIRKEENQFYIMNEKNELVFLLEENDEEEQEQEQEQEQGKKQQQYLDELSSPIHNNNSLWIIPEVSSIVNQYSYPSTFNRDFKYNKMRIVNDHQSSKKTVRKKKIISNCVQMLARIFLSSFLIALFLALIMFTSTIVYAVYCMKKYPAPGIQVEVSLYNETEISYLASVSSGTTLQSLSETNTFEEEEISKFKHPTSDMHIYCTGTKRMGSPLIVFEAAQGLHGFEYYKQQQLLAQINVKTSKSNYTSTPTGIRSCSYDRGGFGWSDNVPIGNNNVYNGAAKLHELLIKSGELDEGRSIILVGHGEGGLYAQTYAYFYPNQVIGLVLIDSYPEYAALHNFNPYRKAESKSFNREKTCMNLNLLRAAGPLGISSLLLTSRQYDNYSDSQKKIHLFDNFNPSSETSRIISTFWNLKNFPAIWNVHCRWQGYSHTDFLTQIASTEKVNYFDDIDKEMIPSNPHYSAADLSWPTLKNPLTRVLILSSPTPTNSPSERDLNTEDSVFFQQAQAYNNTLSPTGNSQWKICENCDFSMPWKEPDWIVSHIVDRFHDLFI